MDFLLSMSNTTQAVGWSLILWSMLYLEGCFMEVILVSAAVLFMNL